MKIMSYGVNLSSSSETIKKYSKTESMQVSVGNSQTPISEEQTGSVISQTINSNLNILEQQGGSVQIFLSKEGIDMSKSVQKSNPTDSENGFDLSDKDKQKILMIEKFIESLTGKKYKIRVMDKLKIDDEKCLTISHSKPNKAASNEPTWGLSYSKQESYEESAKMSFSASGVVKTADGKEIGFDISLNMSYTFVESNDIAIRAGSFAKDPLVINFDGELPALTEEKYSFDIDIDGQKEKISMPGEGSGFLALDKNLDGIINDGSELFGARTGDGFSELAEYDSDKNGWIDENDPVFDKLKIMIKSPDSDDFEYHSLKDEKVGAIFLGNVETNYDLNGQDNITNGTIRKSGFFLKEDGTASSIQHIDLNV